jgi:hypothetical protein
VVSRIERVMIVSGMGSVGGESAVGLLEDCITFLMCVSSDGSDLGLGAVRNPCLDSVDVRLL